MNEQLNKPKGFGEILDAAFQLCKSRFSDFFMIALILLGPLYLLQAVLLLLSGTSFFREIGGEGSWFEQIISSFEETANTSVGEDLANITVGLPILVLAPVAQAAVLLAVNRLKKNQEFTVGAVIKQGFSSFWSILGSSLIFGLIVFGMIVAPFIIVMIVGVISIVASPTSGIVIAIILFLGIGLVVAYLLTRWSFYLGATVFEDDIPGLGKSWHLTRRHSWKVLGIFLVFSLIFLFISLGFESIFILFLGNSVLYTIILSLVRLVTMTIFMVGYAIVYFDLKLRNDGDDLKNLIDDYETTNN